MSSENPPNLQDIASIKYLMQKGALGQVLVVLKNYNHPLWQALSEKPISPITPNTYEDLGIDENDVIRLANFITFSTIGRWITSLILVALGLLDFALFAFGFHLLSHSEPYGIVLIGLTCAASPFALVCIGLGLSNLRTPSW